MIDVSVVINATKLKKEMDAAYLVFKKAPSVENSTKWTAATRAYNDYCIKTITKLVNEHIDATTHFEDVLANFDKYSKCDVCGAELLYPTNENDEGKVQAYIESSDFVEGFAGICYPCLVEHCMSTECAECSRNTRPTCLFREVKELHKQEES